MKRLSTAQAILFAFLAFGTPAVLTGQQVEPQVPQVSAEVESLITEYEQVHGQLEGIQMQALQDPELNGIQEELGNRIREAMESHDPSISGRIARAQTLETELTAAQQAGDVPRLQELMEEVQQIEQHFITVQQAVIEQPAIANQITAFQTRLEQKMGELNPEAPVLISRFKELESRLEAAMRAGA